MLQGVDSAAGKEKGGGFDLLGSGIGRKPNGSPVVGCGWGKGWGTANNGPNSTPDLKNSQAAGAGADVEGELADELGGGAERGLGRVDFSQQVSDP
jgi:hypothetical protein